MLQRRLIWCIQRWSLCLLQRVIGFSAALSWNLTRVLPGLIDKSDTRNLFGEMCRRGHRISQAKHRKIISNTRARLLFCFYRAPRAAERQEKSVEIKLMAKWEVSISEKPAFSPPEKKTTATVRDSSSLKGGDEFWWHLFPARISTVIQSAAAALFIPGGIIRHAYITILLSLSISVEAAAACSFMGRDALVLFLYGIGRCQRSPNQALCENNNKSVLPLWEKSILGIFTRSLIAINSTLLRFVDWLERVFLNFFLAWWKVYWINNLQECLRFLSYFYTQ